MKDIDFAPQLFFGSPIENKPSLPDGFRFIERRRHFLVATDGKSEYFVSKEALFLKDPILGFICKSQTIKL